MLYYYLRPGENIETIDVQAPMVEKLIEIAGTSTSNRVKNITSRALPLRIPITTLSRSEVRGVNRHARLPKAL